MTNRHEFDQPVFYRIIVKGILPESWSDWFDGFTIFTRNNHTILNGMVTDQAALHGILAKINELGLSIISVTRLPQHHQEPKKENLS